MKKVNKSMSPEEITIARNAISALEQLIQINGGSNPVDGQENDEFENYNEPSLMKAENELSKEDELEDEKENKAEKNLISTPNDGANGNDDAKEKIDENETKITEDSLKEVAKAILGLTNVVKSVYTRQNESEKAITGILEGLGVTKEMSIQKSVTAAPVVKPIANMDIDSVKKMLKEAMTEMSVEKSEISFDNNATTVRKNLANLDVLNGLLGRNPAIK